MSTQEYRTELESWLSYEQKQKNPDLLDLISGIAQCLSDLKRQNDKLKQQIKDLRPCI